MFTKMIFAGIGGKIIVSDTGQYDYDVLEPAFVNSAPHT